MVNALEGDNGNVAEVAPCCNFVGDGKTTDDPIFPCFEVMGIC